ncbi:MAG: hypothetical protein ABIN89_01470 [Chitinophagaceae bacterium]
MVNSKSRKKPVSIQASFDFEFPVNTKEKQEINSKHASIPWIEVAKGIPYFITEHGDTWAPIGQNDAITWPELAGAYRRKDLASVDAYFSMLTRHGVNCLRLMLEYCQDGNRYLEKPVGYFKPNMIRMWDDIFSLCEKYSLRVLLTPYDTFWMWRRWSDHPYNIINNGVCSKRSQWLLCPEMRNAIKNRLYFVTQRWGASGVIFAWDLWNEISPSHGGNSAKGFSEFINDIGSFLRKTETELYGRAHPQTVSVFSSLLEKNHGLTENIFQHQALDFATIHLYENNTIDNPKNTIEAAISTGRLTRQVINEIKDQRPFFDSEHGPIKTFSGYRKTLPTEFDEEYFRHMQWAHFASGGAGGGMRWPYRYPHVLTTGMRAAQLALSGFVSLISWKHFYRVNLNEEIKLSDEGLTSFGCGDNEQAIVWLLRTNAIGKNKLLEKNTRAAPFYAFVPLLRKGSYDITLWDTVSGKALRSFEEINNGLLKLSLPGVSTDLAIAIKRING